MHLPVIGTITTKVLIDCMHMLYSWRGNVLVGNNVNFSINGRDQPHPLHNVQRHETPKIHLQVVFHSWFGTPDSLAFTCCGMPHTVVICCTLKNKRQRLTKYLQFEPHILQRKNSTFVRFVPFSKIQVFGNGGLKTTEDNRHPQCTIKYRQDRTT